MTLGGILGVYDEKDRKAKALRKKAQNETDRRSGVTTRRNQ